MTARTNKIWNEIFRKSTIRKVRKFLIKTYEPNNIICEKDGMYDIFTLYYKELPNIHFVTQGEYSSAIFWKYLRKILSKQFKFLEFAGGKYCPTIREYFKVKINLKGA